MAAGRFSSIDGLPEQVQHATQQPLTHWHAEGVTHADDRIAAREARGRGERNGSHYLAAMCAVTSEDHVTTLPSPQLATAPREMRSERCASNASF